jgi:WD40 repeat protein
LNGVEVFSFNGGDELLHVLWSPDGRQIATADVDGTIRIFYGANERDLCSFSDDQSVLFSDRLAQWRLDNRYRLN